MKDWLYQMEMVTKKDKFNMSKSKLILEGVIIFPYFMVLGFKVLKCIKQNFRYAETSKNTIHIA